MAIADGRACRLQGEVARSRIHEQGVRVAFVVATAEVGNARVVVEERHSLPTVGDIVDPLDIGIHHPAAVSRHDGGVAVPAVGAAARVGGGQYGLGDIVDPCVVLPSRLAQIAKRVGVVAGVLAVGVDGIVGDRHVRGGKHVDTAPSIQVGIIERDQGLVRVIGGVGSAAAGAPGIHDDPVAVGMVAAAYGIVGRFHVAMHVVPLHQHVEGGEAVVRRRGRIGRIRIAAGSQRFVHHVGDPRSLISAGEGVAEDIVVDREVPLAVVEINPRHIAVMDHVIEHPEVMAWGSSIVIA